jgi:lipopolysaccharide transport system ATP-binding protein
MSYAIEVEGLSKRYRLGMTHSRSLRDVANRTAARIARSFSRRGSQAVASARSSKPANEFWALRDVSFSIPAGEVVGVIGRNGAGKSTLLKILSRITRPTNGRALLQGRVASLLEVGTGFHPELSGRENVFLNGTLLGMTKLEVARQFDEIVAFSGVEKFIDTPTKRYSSGMTVRLGFAVAAHLDPEILIVDEVLAVGDNEFQERCLGKMKEVAQGGRTVLFVSHNLASVRQLTSRCLVMQQGQLAFDGATQAGIHFYVHRGSESSARRRNVAQLERLLSNLTGAMRIEELELLNCRDGQFLDGDSLHFEVAVSAKKSTESFRVGMTVFSDDHTPVGSTFSGELESIQAHESRTVRLRIPEMRLAPGDYYCAMSLMEPSVWSGCQLHDAISEVLHFRVAGGDNIRGVKGWEASWGSCRLPAICIDEVEGK